MKSRFSGRQLNLALLMFAVVLTAWLLSPEKSIEEPYQVVTSSPSPTITTVPGSRVSGERYFSGNRFNGVILEIRGDQYIETYKAGPEPTATVISKGRHIKDNETVFLVEEETGFRRTFRRTGEPAFYVSSPKDKILVYRKTDRAWEDLLLKRKPTYSIDGIRLGNTIEEVEAHWGRLVQDPETSNTFRPAGGKDKKVELDEYGRVDSIRGTRLLEGKAEILSTDDRFGAALQVGSERVSRSICGGGGPYAIRFAQRVLGDCNVEVISYNEEVLKEQDPDGLKKFKRNGGQVDKILSLTLSFKYRPADELLSNGLAR